MKREVFQLSTTEFLILLIHDLDCFLLSYVIRFDKLLYIFPVSKSTSN